MNQPMMNSQPMPPPPMPAFQPSPPPPPKRREPLDRKDRSFAVLFFLFCLLWVDTALMHGFHIGFPVSMICFFLLLTVYLVGKGTPLRLYPLACGLFAVAGTIPFALYQDTLIRLVSFGASVGLLTLYGGLLTHSFSHKAGSFRSVEDVMVSLLVYPPQFMGTMLRSLFAKPPAGGTPNPASSKKPLGKIILGLLCALPALAILIPLLVRSDAYFEQLLSHISLDLPGLVGRLLLAALAFLFLFSLLFAWRKRLPGTVSPAPSTFKGIDPVAVQSFLSAISLVYLVYLLTQTAYFFSGFQGLLPEGFTQSVTDYARRGFFEMCAIAAINLVMLFLTSVLVRKEEGKIPLVTRLLNSFLCLFTLLLIGTALSKMMLYIGHFGITRLRLITSCFMVFLVLVFLAVLLRLWVRKFPYMKAIVLSFCLVGLTVSFANIDSVMAWYNLRAYQENRLETIDVEALERLGDHGVPALIQLLDDADPEVASQARDSLIFCLQEHFELESQCGREFCNCDEFHVYLEQNMDYSQEEPTYYYPGLEQKECSATPTLRPTDSHDWRDYNHSRRVAEQLLKDHAEQILIP